jgi:hypothetical protein
MRYDLDGAVAHLGGWFDERLRETKKRRVFKNGRWVTEQVPKYTAQQAIALLERAAARMFGVEHEAKAEPEKQYADPSTLLAMGLVRM